jgi:hypothetical protein
MLSKNKILTFLASISIFLTFYACQKSFQLMSPESTSGVYNTNVAKTYYESIISSEESLLAMPYDQLKKNANLRRFARIGKMESLLDWENAQSFYRDKTNYTIVQVENISKHQANPNFESNRSLLFIQKDGDKMEMNIIEVYKKNTDLNEVELSSGIKTFAENKIFNENKIIVGLNASILFYDQYYYNKSSFTVTNGIWEHASIIIENTSKRISSNSLNNKTVFGNNVSNTNNLSLSTTSPMSGCINCTEYFTVGIWYDKRTGKVIESEILDKWDECKEPDYPANGNAPGTSILPKLPPSDKKKIINKIQDPCISKTLDKINNVLEGFVMTMLINDDIDVQMNFIFEEDITLADTVNASFGQFLSNNEGGFNFYINLNQNTLPNYSNEYNTKTMLHEMIHGILLYKGMRSSGQLQHNSISNYYRGLISSVLLSIYPQLTSNEAEALSWGGLHNTSAWGLLTRDKQIEIEAILFKFSNGKDGTRCQ